MAIRYLSGINVDSNTLFVDSTNNRVGIGTGSPTYKLDVVGEGRTSDAFMAGGAINIDNNLAIQISSAGAGTQRWIGINKNNGYGLIIGYVENAAALSGVGAYIRQVTSDPIHFLVNNATTAMSIFSSGNVLIGTTTDAGYKLAVAGSTIIGGTSVSIVNLYLTRTAGGIAADANYFVSGNNTPNHTWIEGGYYTGELAGVVTAPNSGYPYFEAYSGQGSATAKSFGFVNKTSGSFISTDFLYTMALLRTGQIRFNQYGSGSFTGTATYGLAVDSSGNIIEVTSTIDGSGTANYVTKWQDANTLTNSVIYDNGTNVGIGTTSPTNKLEVDGGSSAVTLRVSTTNTSNGVSALVLSNSSKSAFNDGMKMAHGGGFTNITDLAGTNIMTWDMSNTRVGIGTTAPYAKLSVVQDISTTAEFGSFGQFTIQGATNVNKILSFGFNTATDAGFIQAMVNGVSYNNLLLNARGGNVLIGTTTDSGFKLDVNGTGRFTSRLTVNATSGGNGIDIVGRTDGFGFLAFKNNANNAINAEIGVSDAQNLLFYIGSTLRLTLGSTGTLNLSAYGSGSKTGTVAYNLAVDASGNIIETPGGVVDGSGTANYVTKWQDANTVTNSSITDDGSTVTALVNRVAMNQQAGIYVFPKSVGASASAGIFEIKNTHGAQALRVAFVCSTSGYSVAKTYEVVHCFAQTPIYSKVVDTGPFSGEDFNVAFTNNGDNTGLIATITNNSTSLTANIVATIFLGGSSTTITITAL
jgi:hypothetical protein